MDDGVACTDVACAAAYPLRAWACLGAPVGLLTALLAVYFVRQNYPQCRHDARLHGGLFSI